MEVALEGPHKECEDCGPNREAGKGKCGKWE